MSVLAIIPARSGSKRLPGKNMKMFCGKPLIQWTIEQANRIKEIDKIVITSDYDIDDLRGEAYSLNQHWQKRIIVHERPYFICDDQTPMAKVICDVLSLDIEWPSLCVLLQPTSPTRTDETVRECIKDASIYGQCFTVNSHPDNYLKPNGACYAFWPNQLPPFRGNATVTSDDIDINTLEDFKRAEAVMRERL